MALAAPISDFAIELNSDGRVIRQGSLDVMLDESALLQAEARHDQENLETSKEDEGKNDNNIEEDTSKGKLIVAEEIALGRVAWPAIKLYIAHFGGPLFWVGFSLRRLCAYLLSQYLFRLVHPDFSFRRLCACLLSQCLFRLVLRCMGWAVRNSGTGFCPCCFVRSRFIVGSIF